MAVFVHFFGLYRYYLKPVILKIASNLNPISLPGNQI